jgi:hypothetical protein
VIRNWWRNCHKPAKSFETYCGDALDAFFVASDRSGTTPVICVGVIDQGYRPGLKVQGPGLKVQGA